MRRVAVRKCLVYDGHIWPFVIIRGPKNRARRSALTRGDDSVLDSDGNCFGAIGRL
jgi:hypothetical protein